MSGDQEDVGAFPVTSVCFLGDIALEDATVEIDDRLLEVINLSSLVVCNLEGPITDREPIKDKASALRTNPRRGSTLTALGVDIAVLANNHIMDFGGAGIRDTIQSLSNLGIASVGAGLDAEAAASMVVRHVAGMRVGVLAFSLSEGQRAATRTPGPNVVCSASQAFEATRKARSDVDLLVVSLHGGEEFTTVPWPWRSALLRDISDAGADIVFGHHAHVVQGYEVVAGRAIIHGAGNFFIDMPYMSRSPMTQLGAAFVVGVGQGGVESVKHLPFTIDSSAQRIGLASTEQVELLSRSLEESASALSNPTLHRREWNRQCYMGLLRTSGWLSLRRAAWTGRQAVQRWAGCEKWIEIRNRQILRAAVEHVRDNALRFARGRRNDRRRPPTSTTATGSHPGS